jgi:hypothetical protein
VIRSGDRIPTGTGAARRRLTREEAEAGGLPEPMTPEEWAAMYYASRFLHNRYVKDANDGCIETHPSQLNDYE